MSSLRDLNDFEFMAIKISPLRGLMELKYMGYQNVIPSGFNRFLNSYAIKMSSLRDLNDFEFMAIKMSSLRDLNGF